MGFRKDFVWGAAASAYQVEGAAGEEGKGLDIWDVYCKEPGRIHEEQSGDRACDHYHLYREDVALMKEMGLKAYRFSVNWSRVLPEGRGGVNEAGIAFYDRLIDALLEAGITPYLTLYHWELPYALYQKGGWMNEEIVEWFGAYAKLIGERFGDRVRHFITLNEPQCFVGMGFASGRHAPGLVSPLRDTFQMAHNALKAHGRAVQMLRAYAKLPAVIGYAPTAGVAYPATEKEEDVEAARRQFFSLPELSEWHWSVAWWSDPVLLGAYPEEGLDRYGAYLPKITEADMRLISEPIDFYAQNIYNGRAYRMGEDGKPEAAERYDGFPRTANYWPVTPECLYWGPKFLCERYRKPFYITENGLSGQDVVSKDGKVHDPARIQFLTEYLGALKRAATEGADIRGYFHWSFTDNFEWTCGYSDRFGLVYVDYRDQRRIRKDSSYWYENVIRTNGAEL